jgi:hypothetical protein
MSYEDQNQGLAVVEPSALEIAERTSIDIQIATAKKYPRSLAKVKNAMLSLATLDEETAASCFYSLPARKGGDGKPIQGASARMAEIALSSYGNIRAGARIIGNDGKVITAQGVVHDLENNVCVSTEVRRRITNKYGQTFSEDMQVVAGNAACSIVLRNAVFKVVPFALVKPIYEKAKQLAIGDAKSLVQRRAAAIEYFVKMGVPRERIFAALGVGGVDDVTLAHLETLTGFRTAITDGDSSVDEVFPDPKKAEAAATAAGAKLASTIGGAAPQAAATAETPNANVQTPNAKGASAAAGEPAQASAQQPAQPATAAEREAVIDEIKNLMLDHGVSEAAVFAYAKRAKLVPEGVDELFALPTDALAKLRYAVPSVLAAKKGGGK